MKTKSPSLGYIEVTYGLENVFRRAVKDFAEADEAKRKIDEEYERTKDGSLIPDLFPPMMRRNEAGVVLLISAVAVLEKTINDFAYTFLDSDSYDYHLGNLRLVTKWMLLPRLCQKKEIEENHPAINALRELVKARNAIVHYRRREISLLASKQTTTQKERFLSACSKAASTVEALIGILTSPPPTPDNLEIHI